MERKVRFVVMEGATANCEVKFRAAIQSLGLDAEVETYSNFFAKGLNRKRIKEMRKLLRRRHPEEQVLFCPGAVEIYLPEPDISFQFSGYRSWYDPLRTIVLPHPWTPAWPTDRKSLIWTTKPPCRVGFMGSTYGNSRFARLTSRLAEPIRQWILKGGFLRSPERAAWLNELGVRFQLMSAFARFETLETVAAEFRRSPDLEPVEVVDTGGFAGTAASQQAYADHLERMTYVLSPRGHENYSWRTYEALRFGRVPVIFDKDMMLPDKIDWHRIALIVPGDEPKLAYQMILNDYRSRSKESFLERQADAFAASRYIDGETWLPEAISKALGMAPAHLEAE